MPGQTRKRKRPTNSPLDPFAVGGIAALSNLGYSQRGIADSEAVRKADGGPVLFHTVGKVLRKLSNDPDWRGQRKDGSGRLRSTTEAEDQDMVQYVLDNRGQKKVTCSKVQRAVGASSVSLVQRRLREAGLRWRRRRCKTLVPKTCLEDRLAWASWVKHCSAGYLRRWVYTDGCSFYLDKTEAQAESSSRASLGKFVYRMDDGTDSLYKDCVGPSSYKKAQGECVRIWGLLVGGRLNITILNRGAKMNRWEYDWIIRRKFSAWLCNKQWPLLVQDGEKCLWCEEPRKAMEQTGIELVNMHPAFSPDLNAIENAWSFLRDRLSATQHHGDEVETRAEFILRLRAAVNWVNKHHKEGMAALARNQRERAKAVEANDGHRTDF